MISMCALVAEAGSHDMSKLQVCVDRKVAPLGSVIVMGLVSCCLLTTWACSMMKWPVAPESPKAYWLCVEGFVEKVEL